MNKSPAAQTPSKKKKGRASTPRRQLHKASYVKKSDICFPELEGLYDVETEIARGTYGIVYKARPIGYEAQTWFACKRIFSTVSCGLIVFESQVAKRLNPYHISPEIFDLVQNKGHYSLIFEYVPHQHFVEYIDCLNIKDMKYYMYQLIRAISVLEEVGIMHRDIKPGNFLFSRQTKRGYLTDFGLAEIITDNNRKAVNPEMEDLWEVQNSLKVHNRNGTRGYLSPECLFKRPTQTTAVDVWSAGVMMLQLFTRRHHFFFVKELEA